jgi:hypothetical protein
MTTGVSLLLTILGGVLFLLAFQSGTDEGFLGAYLVGVVVAALGVGGLGGQLLALCLHPAEEDFEDG